jgi:uncharacterized membrane protein YhaH (DUF805 family)
MIKDQCNNCKKNGTASCGQTIVFNSLPCENYIRKLDLSKSNDKAVASPAANPPQQPTPQPAPQPTPQPNNSANGVSSDSSFWKSLFSFNGRIRRTRYWLTAICTNLLFLPANVAGDNMSDGVATFTLLIAIPALWILFANIAKRCHDLGKSGFFGLLLIIPVVNIFIGIYLAFFQGDLNDNEYGPSPY